MTDHSPRSRSRTAAALGLGLALAPTIAWCAAAAAAPLDEMRASFTIGGKPVPPEIFRDFGDGDLADSGSIWQTVDAQAAIGSNLYFDEIKTNGTWLTQTKAGSQDRPAEETGYRYVGATRNHLLVAIASYNGGGSGTFYTLHILDAAAVRGFDLDGKRYGRIDVTNVRSVVLGDRWDGEVKIDGNAVAITTRGGVPAAQVRPPTVRVVQAERP